MKNKRAFTLAEVMIATLVSVVALVSIMLAYTRCLEVLHTSKNINVATNAAQGLMATIRNTPFPQVEANYDDTTFVVNAIASSMGVVYVDAGNPNLLRVTISVCWQEKNRVVGEDTNLNGVLNAGEDVNGNGIIDSPIQIITIMGNR